MKTFRKLSADKYVKTVINEEGRETEVEIEDEEKPVGVTVSTPDEVSEDTFGKFIQIRERCEEIVAIHTRRLADANDKLVIAAKEESDARKALGIE